MENKAYHISSYCLMRDNKVILNDEIVFTDDNQSSPTLFFKEIYHFLSLEYPKFHKMDLLCKGAFLATEYITKKSPVYGQNVALILSNYSSSYVSDKKHADGIFDKDNPTASPAVFVYTLPNIIMGELSIRHKLYSENIFYIFDCFNPNFLVDCNEQFLNQKKADKILSGWVEVTENKYDIFLYMVEKEGEYSHTSENIMKLYKQEL